MFGDKLSIKHMPILHQEGLSLRNLLRESLFIRHIVVAQVFLVCTACIYRADASYLSGLTRSSPYLNAISNRLAASSKRASLLGIFVGTAVSELLDLDGQRLNFNVDEVDTNEGRWYKSLTRLNDPLGSISDLGSVSTTLDRNLSSSSSTTSRHNKKSKALAQSAPKSRVISIEEVDDRSDLGETDLPTYAKPDSDASDSDEDPTLVRRDKLVAPV